MKDINGVYVVGRLTRDMELRSTSNGFSIGKLSLAVNTTQKEGNEYKDYANFFDVTILGKTAETLQKYLTKGKQIGVVGTLKQERWEKDGDKRSKIVIVAESVQLLGGKSDSEPKQQPKDEYSDDIPF